MVLFFILLLPKSGQAHSPASTLSYCRSSLNFGQSPVDYESPLPPPTTWFFCCSRYVSLILSLHIIVSTSRLDFKLYHMLTVTAALGYRHCMCMCTYNRSNSIPSACNYCCFPFRDHIAEKNLCIAEMVAGQNHANRIFQLEVIMWRYI